MDTGTVEQPGTGETCNTRSKSRAFIGTWNNYPENYEEVLKQFKKFVFQKEIGESGNEHIQFAVYSKNPKGFEGMRKSIPEAHIKVAKS